MRELTYWALLSLALVLPGSSYAQQAPVTLDRLVPLERQKALGFDKLTPDQRAGVVRLLQEVYQLGVQNGQQTASAGSQGRGVAATPSVIETEIDGDFSGWEGETIVKLMNGQIWQQTEYHYHYHYHYAFMPKVLIYRSGGGYKMKVDGVDKAVGVSRLR
jgi:hypothetical protein